MTEWLIVVFSILVGLGVGSFLNVVIDRLPSRQSLVRPPSHCPDCGHRILAKDMVPVFSYLWLLGKCRYCKTRIPARVLLVEASTATLFGLVVAFLGISPSSLILIGITCLFLVLSVIDLELQILPNRLVIPGVPIVLLLFPLGAGTQWDIGEAYLRALTGACIGFGILLVLFLIARGGM